MAGGEWLFPTTGPMQRALVPSLSVVLMVVTGTARTFVAKTIMQMGLQSPFLLTFGMFLGMAVCVVVEAPRLIAHCRTRRAAATAPAASVVVSFDAGIEIPTRSDSGPSRSRRGGASKGGVASTAATSVPPPVVVYWLPLSVLWRVAIPAVLDLVGTALNFMALLWLPAAVNEVLRSGMELLATALIVALWRRRPMSCTRWAMLVVVTAGLVLVSGSNLMIATPDPSQGQDSGACACACVCCCSETQLL